nr:nucleoside hydrolase-like domain-containing protein [Tessaracoccus sp. MC1627]
MHTYSIPQCYAVAVQHIPAPQSVPPASRPRTIITTDSEADDINSFLRLLYYANELDIVGLIYNSSVHHWQGDGLHTLREAQEAGVLTSFMGETAGSEARSDDALTWRWEPMGWMERIILEDYAQIYPNLLRHDQSYPSPADLWATVAVGNIAFESDFSADTEGSNLIKAALLDDDPRPLYLQVWGGTNTIARALLSIELEHIDSSDWAEIRAAVVRKAVILSIGQQDTAYADYIAEAWPDIPLLDFDGAFGGFTSFSRRFASPEVLPYYQASFWAPNIKYGHGPVLAHYGLIGDGTYFEGEGDNPGWQPGMAKDPSRFKMFDLIGGFERLDWTGEGDTPAFMGLIPTGLRFVEDPSLGGWGGRLVATEANPHTFVAGEDHNPHAGLDQRLHTVARWTAAFQNDFAARADWGITPDYRGANHAPVVSGPADVTLAPGGSATLVATASDPDGDALSVRWWVYAEAGTLSDEPTLESDGFEATITLPSTAQPGQRAVVVIEVTDDGTPALTRYAQVVVTVG